MRISWVMEAATEVMEAIRVTEVLKAIRVTEVMEALRVTEVLEVMVGLVENMEAEREGNMEAANIIHFKVERVMKIDDNFINIGYT